MDSPHCLQRPRLAPASVWSPRFGWLPSGQGSEFLPPPSHENAAWGRATRSRSTTTPRSS